MNDTLKKLKDITSDCCVTIILKTHTTFPDNEQDPIVIKNLIKEAESRLLATYGKAVANSLAEKLTRLADSIDHRFNMESLVLFVNENIAEYISLPVPVENRVVIDKTFATRDLVRTLHHEEPYYILVLNRDKARLIEALSDKVVKEVKEGFPIENTYHVPVKSGEAAIANRQSNLILEFFNLVDKQLNAVRKENPLPVLICTEESNYGEYLKVADRKEIIAGNLNGNHNLYKPHQIVEEAWPVMTQLKAEKNHKRLEELAKAKSSGNFVTDFNEIWRTIGEGRGRTLFVKQGYFQPARLENNEIQLVSPDHPEQANVDDIIDEMIEKNLEFGGDAVFVNGDDLADYQDLVLVTRY